MTCFMIFDSLFILFQMSTTLHLFSDSIQVSSDGLSLNEYHRNPKYLRPYCTEPLESNDFLNLDFLLTFITAFH